MLRTLSHPRLFIPTVSPYLQKVNVFSPALLSFTNYVSHYSTGCRRFSKVQTSYFKYGPSINIRNFATKSKPPVSPEKIEASAIREILDATNSPDLGVKLDATKRLCLASINENSREGIFQIAGIRLLELVYSENAQIKTFALTTLGNLAFTDSVQAGIRTKFGFEQFITIAKDDTQDIEVRKKCRRLLAILGVNEFFTAGSLKTRGVRILTIDGGGTRGVVALELLRKLEEVSGKKVHELFDLVGGTSTGAHISAAISVKRLSLAEHQKMYMEQCISIFSSKLASQPNTTATSAAAAAAESTTPNTSSSTSSPTTPSSATSTTSSWSSAITSQLDKIGIPEKIVPAQIAGIISDVASKILPSSSTPASPAPSPTPAASPTSPSSDSTIPSDPTTETTSTQTSTADLNLASSAAQATPTTETTLNSTTPSTPTSSTPAPTAPPASTSSFNYSAWSAAISSQWDRLYLFSNVLTTGAFYKSKNLEDAMFNFFEDKILIDTSEESNLRFFALATVVNSLPPRPFVFRNYEYPPELRSRYGGTCTAHVWQALRASTAAPTYFDEFVMGTERFQDGGVVANNPTAIAYHEAKKIWGPDVQIDCIVSLGTGKRPVVMTANSFKDTISLLLYMYTLDLFSDIPQIITLVSSATSSDRVHEVMEDVFPDGHYFRINPEGEAFSVQLDETQLDKLEAMQVAARAFADENEHVFVAAAKRLTLPDENKE